MKMLRYEFIRRFYWILRILADCYFMLINAIFRIYNVFQPAKCVQWAKEDDEDQKLLFIPANKAAKMIREKKLSSKQLISAYIERIKAVDPLINAMRENNFDEALKQAEECEAQLAKMSDAQLAELAQKKPLFGVPFTSKDNLQTKGFKISACNYNLAKTALKCADDAPIVERVRSAGAILLGTTTMPNLGLSWACDDSDCGIANNPHDTRRIPGGSSSGEGALISAGGSLFGIGNDIGGSIRIPANMCGIFGLKPTNFPDHTVPVEGIVPNFLEYKPAGEMLSNGPLVRYAEDLALVLSVMTNKPLSEYDKSVDFKKEVKVFYIEELDILISERLHPEQREVGRKVKSYFELKYDLQVQKVDFPLMNRLFEFWGLTGWSEGVVSFPELFSQFWQLQAGKSDHTFFKWNYDVLKHFVHPKSDEEAEFVSGKLEKLRHQLNELLGPNGVLLTPAWPIPPPFHHMEPFETFNLRYTQMFNMLGFPALTVPIGKSASTKMPLGIQLAAAPFNEALLISIGKELEKAFGGWVVPGKVPKKLLEIKPQ